MAYRPAGLKHLDAWLEAEPDERIRERVLVWLTDLCANPDIVGVHSIPVPGHRLPAVAAFVPDTDVAVTYHLAEPFKILVLLHVETVPGS